MILLPNIIIPDELQARIDGNTLTIADHLLLSLANFTASLFPAAMTYTETQQQGVDGPAVFIDFYSMKNVRQLVDTDKFIFGIEITYVPKIRISQYELNSAIFAIQQSLNTLESDIGTFSCYEKDSDITDDLAHVTGTITVEEITVPTDPIVKSADKELTT